MLKPLTFRPGECPHGIKINQIVIGNVPVDLNVDVKLYALSPLLIWVSDRKVLGANYGAYIGPAFSNANIGASLSVAQGQGINPETSQFAAGDLFVQPLWLGWNRKHFDVALGYGFYAPVGKFDTQTLTLSSRNFVLEATLSGPRISSLRSTSTPPRLRRYLSRLFATRTRQ